jgi:acyl carrier protein
MNLSHHQDLVRSTVASVLAVEETMLSAEVDLSEVGVDSIARTMIANRLAEACNFEFEPGELTEFFRATSITELAQLLERLTSAPNPEEMHDAAGHAGG